MYRGRVAVDAHRRGSGVLETQRHAGDRISYFIGAGGDRELTFEHRHRIQIVGIKGAACVPVVIERTQTQGIAAGEAGRHKAIGAGPLGGEREVAAGIVSDDRGGHARVVGRVVDGVADPGERLVADINGERTATDSQGHGLARAGDHSGIGVGKRGARHQPVVLGQALHIHLHHTARGVAGSRCGDHVFIR